MTETDRADLLARLAACRADLLASVEGMSDAEAGAEPGPGRWSAIGNIEHLAMAETILVGRVRDAAPAAGEAAPGHEARIFESLKMRGRKVQAPPATYPTGECRTLAEAMAKFDAARGRTIEFVQSCPHDPRLCTVTHPLIGDITGMECLFLVAAHPSRHAAQIRELRGLAG